MFLVQVFPWSFNHKVGLIGDAAHAIVPFYGQGMNCGFEDCAELNRLIEKHDHDWDAIFPAYENARKPNGDAIAELKFRTDQINDIIKSMVVQDFGGGKIGIISYASQDPIEKTLRSFGVDLKSATGLELVRRLVPMADVLIENSGTGVMDRLGLGYDDVKALNPLTLGREFVRGLPIFYLN